MEKMTPMLLMLVMLGVFIESSQAIQCYVCVQCDQSSSSLVDCETGQNVCLTTIANVNAGGVSVEQVTKSCATSSGYDYLGCKSPNAGGGGVAVSTQICVCDTSGCNKPGKASAAGGGESKGVQTSSFSHLVIAVALITGVVTARLM